MNYARVTRTRAGRRSNVRGSDLNYTRMRARAPARRNVPRAGFELHAHARTRGGGLQCCARLRVDRLGRIDRESDGGGVVAAPLEAAYRRAERAVWSFVDEALANGPLEDVELEVFRVRHAALVEAREVAGQAIRVAGGTSLQYEVDLRDNFGAPCRAELESMVARWRGWPWVMREPTPMPEYTIEEAAAAVGAPVEEILRAVILGRIQAPRVGRRQARISEAELADYMSIRSVWPACDKAMAEGWRPRRPRDWARHKPPEPAWDWAEMPIENWASPSRLTGDGRYPTT